MKKFIVFLKKIIAIFFTKWILRKTTQLIYCWLVKMTTIVVNNLALQVPSVNSAVHEYFIKMQINGKIHPIYHFTPIANWTYYYTMVYKNYKNLRNGHFLQFRTNITLLKMQFAKFWYIREWSAPVCIIGRLEKLGFL